MKSKMDYLPQKFLFALPLRVGGAVLGAIGVIMGIVGICGGLQKGDNAVEILGFGIFSVRSLSGNEMRNFASQAVDKRF